MDASSADVMIIMRYRQNKRYLGLSGLTVYYMVGPVEGLMVPGIGGVQGVESVKSYTFVVFCIVHVYIRTHERACLPSRTDSIVSGSRSLHDG